MTDENLVQINFRNIFTCQVSVEELKSLLGKYSNTESLAQSGVTVAAKKYMFLSSTDRVVRARKGTSGLHCIKTVQGRPPLFFISWQHISALAWDYRYRNQLPLPFGTVHICRVADPDPHCRIGSGFNRVSGSGSGPRSAKMTHKFF